MDFNKPSRIVVTCMKRLAPYVEQELHALGFTSTRVFQTGVAIEGTLNDCIKLNLNLRCASQVLYSIREFKADDPEMLYKNLLYCKWEDILIKDGYFSVTNNVDNLFVNNSMFVNVKVKDAIVDRMRRETGMRPDSGAELDGAVINLYWKDNWAEVFVDTSGPKLSKHGYRKIPGKAPMLEALAAATIMASKWDKASAFVNPMCGSSTLAIEAALIATNRAPGLYRDNYAFMHLLGYTDDVYKSEMRALRAQVKDVPLTIIATDISQDAIDISKVNAREAQVLGMIKFDRCDFELTRIPEEDKGVVFFNPEYGERLGDVQELEETYARIGDFMKKNCKGYMGYIYTGNLDLAKKIGLKAKRRVEFYSAKIDCRLLEYELYDGTKRTDKL